MKTIDELERGDFVWMKDGTLHMISEKKPDGSIATDQYIQKGEVFFYKCANAIDPAEIHSIAADQPSWAPAQGLKLEGVNRYDVHIYPIHRVKVSDVLAPTPELATRIADERALKMMSTMAPVDWEKYVDGLKDVERRELSEKLDGLMQWAARAFGYVEDRHGSGCGDQGHAAAVARSNKVVAGVRKAIGYSQPKHDISF